MKACLTKLIFLALISSFWLLLAGKEGIIAYPILSITSILAVVIISEILGLVPKKYYNPFKLLSYIGWLIREIIISSIDVAKIIWQPTLEIKPRIVEIETDFAPSSPELIIFANSITLTPGTFTIDLEENKILVHALTTKHIRDLRSGIMQQKVKSSFTD